MIAVLILLVVLGAALGLTGTAQALIVGGAAIAGVVMLAIEAARRPGG